MLRLLLIVFIVLNLFSCNKLKDDKKFKVGFSQCISTDDWRKSMDHEMTVEASLNAEIDLTIFQANGDIELQNSQIEFMLSNGFDIIIVSPLRSEPLVPIIEKAYDKGIPVIIVDRKIKSQKFTAYIGANNIDVGRNAANYIASQNEKKINVLEIKGGDDSSPVIERHLGFHQIIDKEPNINVVYSIRDEYVNQRIPQILDSLNMKQIDYVYAFNDEIAYNTWKIAKSKGVEKAIKFIGVDGLNGDNNGIQLVQNGILSATILYPTGGDEAIKIAMKILRNENVPKNNVLNTTVIDYRNAEIMKNQYDKIKKHQNDIEIQQEKIKKQEQTYSTQSNILKILLGLLITSLLLAAYSIYSAYNIKKRKRELELRNQKITIQRNQIKKIAEEVKISNEAKVNFFTGLSHEFKTPITLILSSIESLNENKVIHDNKLLNEIGLIFNNSKRLLRLINQLLDFRKIEDRKFVLKASKTNLYQFSNLIFKDFEREAQKRDINFTLSTNNEDLSVFLDRNLMDKVYFNLLSNAFKFTPNNGVISIDIVDDFDNNFVKIHFKDSGIGIPKKEMNNVFQAFFQGSNNNKASSGIGLHLSKEFIEMHKGTIEVNSKHGTEFIITLYKDNAHLNSDEIVYEPDVVDSAIINSNSAFEDDDFDEQFVLNDDEHYSVLIIEDNPDLVKYLKGKLSSEYNVHISDGTDGTDKAIEIIPDIILCDISLPDKSGFEICEILKKDLRTSHIPTIILTALNNKESYIKSLEVGADLFLTKPFSFAILSQSIKTLIYNREKLRYYFVNNVHNMESINNFGSLEQEFMSKVNKIIDENIDNSKFSVENLASNLNISRIQLYRKMKAIIGVNVSDYIQNIRLEKAKTLLNKTQLTISEIAYATGFSSPNYFSTSFKNKFNKSPKAFRED
ncbi:hybrid sensor histidine kinase/response regulator transcription factor [Winogradskyella schleiferi]|uniref:hybrid sensor histidine kinase/response regulator transcription factor n=1 Tax=Winogradskyella schleiferi TaxID=2686078 RepID=UPI0015BEC40B|nr:substrate-binding domain-containing protein [Winogradskyella schleiferi]